ncbi:EF-hand domain-containing protein [Luteolibacter soli]|uniref:EF-hand domain-containing protein n=1 Tax=Luteolibacter soli TaxID=3135280 RepID=A0ABU9B0B0_9BACT
MKTPLFPWLVLAGVCVAVPPGMTTSTAAFLDVNGDGNISELERQAYDEARNSSRGQGNKIWDTNGDGQVDETERQAAVVELKNRMDQKVASLFLDLAGDDQLLTLEEFSTLPRYSHVPPHVPANHFNHMDENEDGFVTLEEFFKGTGRGKPPAPPGQTKDKSDKDPKSTTSP